MKERKTLDDFHSFVLNRHEVMQQGRKIILIGFMGAGKSTLGKRIQTERGIPFVDLDDWIESWQGKTIREIFREEGEIGFRKLETEALKKLTDQLAEEWVLSCGGGTPCFNENMELLNRMGQTVYLRVSPEELTRRLLPQRGHRPLIAHYSSAELKGFISEMLSKRKEFYEKAHLHIDEDKVGEWFLGL